jgi:D-alanyl-D-alanine carboxypeptidase
MANVTALSGYVRSTQGERLAFSILVNGYAGGAALARSDTDALVELLADFARRSRD